jgi:hypothetical protein
MDDPLFQKVCAEFNRDLDSDYLILDTDKSIFGVDTKILEYVGWERNYTLTYFRDELQVILVVVPGQMRKTFYRTLRR